MLTMCSIFLLLLKYDRKLNQANGKLCRQRNVSTINQTKQRVKLKNM